jgi:hypothetical protein
MIHELRTYGVLPNQAAQYVEHSGTVGRAIRGDRFGTLIGYFTTDVGPLNQVVHIWEYEDMAARSAARAGLARDPRWTGEYLPLSGPLLTWQENMILLPVDWLPLRSVTGMGIYELLVNRLRPGQTGAYLKALQEAMPARETHSAPVGFWTTEIGPLNSFVALWPYRDLQHRAQVRAAAGADPAWQAGVARLAPFLQAQESKILVPTSFSPLR